MFPWSNVHVINACVYNTYVSEYDTNSPKENVPPPLPVPYPKIYPIVVPVKIPRLRVVASPFTCLLI